MLGAAFLLLASAVGPYDPVFHGEFELPTTCPNTPLTRLVVSNIAYQGDGTNGTRPNVDMTLFDNIWGHADPYDDVVSWPGRANSSPVINDFGKTQYLAARFHVPDNAVPSLFGWLGHTEYMYGQDLTSSISTYCGDFRPSSAQCFLESISGQTLTRWRASTSQSMCVLQPGQDYYYNIKMTDPTRPSSTCPQTADVCRIGTLNAFGGG